MKSIIAITLGMILSGTCLADIGNRGTEGHGGDPLTQLFNDARAYTAQRIENAKACSFTAGTRPEVVNWIMTRQFDLANDVRQSAHTWITDAQATCAFTQTNRMAPITFSYEACRPNIREVNDAVAILAHESAHHFGVTDEPFADEVGRAIQRLGQNCDCNPVPGTDPFDPNSCPGRDVSASELYSWIPLPNATSKKLGSFKTYVRQRTCYGPNFCTTWKESNANFRGDNGALNPTGRVAAILKDNKPQIFLDSPYIPSTLSPWKLFAEVDSSQTLNVTRLPYTILLDFVITKNKDFKSKLTPTCYRGTVSKTRAKKDQDGNDITVETDMVILSQFK